MNSVSSRACIKVSFAAVLFALVSFAEAGDRHRVEQRQDVKRASAHAEQRRFHLHKKKHKSAHSRRVHRHYSTRRAHRDGKMLHHRAHQHKRYHHHHHKKRHHHKHHHRSTKWGRHEDVYWGLRVGGQLGNGAFWSINPRGHIRFVSDAYGDCFRVVTRAHKEVWTQVHRFHCR